MMKAIISALMIFCIYTTSIGQPNGNGSGNGGNGNNGNGSGGCGNPPCGGPNSVPLDEEWLLCAGLLAGFYMKFSRKRKAKL